MGCNMLASYHTDSKSLRFIPLLAALLASMTVVSCGGGGGNSPPAPTLSSISITPSTPSIARGTTQQFTATGTYSDASTRNLSSSVAWESGSTSVATISSSGLATAAGIGTSTIRATTAGITGTTTLTVTAPVLTSVAVTPSSVIFNYKGATRQFIATGTYSDQSTAQITGSVTWESSAPAAVSIESDGLATAVASNGSATITARSGTIQGTASVDVQTAVVSGTVTLPSTEMGWQPSIAGLQSQGDGGKVRVLGTDIVADVVPTGTTTGTFSLSGVPLGGAVTLQFDEGSYYDIFSAASKRATVNVASAAVTGVSFNFAYHWRELAGYPPPWGTNNSQGPVSWKTQFLSENLAFIAFRIDVPSERVEVWRTQDRGATWTRVGQWIFDQALWDTGSYAYPTWDNFYFLDASRGVMHATSKGIPCDGGGAYFQTGDGGQTWNTRALPLAPTTGYHVQTQGYARIGADRIVMAGTIGCGVQGYVSGFFDAIWESPDAGVTWAMQWHSPRDSSGAFIGIDANSAGRAVAYRGGGIQEFMLRDPQGNWTARANPGGIRNDSRDVSMIGEETWLISSGGAAANGLYRSPDAGTNWAQVSGGLPQDFDFVTSLKAFAQAGGPAVVTYDGGVSWHYQAAGGAIWPGVMDVWGFDRTHAAWAEVGFGDPNQRGQLFTYVEPAQASVSLASLPVGTSATVGRGSTGNILARAELRSDGPVPVSISSVTLHASGSGNDATGVAAIKLWRDSNGDGAVDAGDALLGTGTFSGDDGTVTFNTAAMPSLQQTQSLQLLVTCDLAPITGYSGSFRVSMAAADIVAQDADGGGAVALTMPAGLLITSRSLHVAP